MHVHGTPNATLVVPIDYHGLRMRHAQVLVRAFLRRWGVYLLLGPAIFGAGSNAPVALASALAGTLMLPLFNASRDLLWWIPVVMLYALAGALPVLLTRPLWWPRRWTSAERALPLPAEAIHRSDRIMSMWVMLPWQCVLLIGSMALAWQDPARRDASLGWVVGGLALSAACALVLSVALMQWVRRCTARRTASDATDHSSASSATPVQRLGSGASSSIHWTSAYFILALRRGPAQGSARILAIGLAVTMACGLGTLSPLSLGWPLTALALASLIFTGMLRGRSEIDLLPLQQANLHLPISPRRWQCARTTLILMPVLGGWLALLPGVLATPGTRFGMLLAYLMVVGSGCTWEAVKVDEASHRTARWLLMLALAAAISFDIASP